MEIGDVVGAKVDCKTSTWSCSLEVIIEANGCWIVQEEVTVALGNKESQQAEIET